MFANCSMMGMDFGFPDVCLTPTPVGPIPIPYPNIGLKPTALPPTANMRCLISMMPAHNLATTTPLTNGDNAGAVGGVMCGMMMGPARGLMGSFKFINGGMPQTTWLKPAMQNLINVPMGMSLVPSQFKFMVLT